MRRHQAHETTSRGRFDRAVRAVLLVLAFGAMAAPAAAQIPKYGRVVTRTTIVRWFPNLPSDVLATVDSGTELEILDEEAGWYWIVAPTDANGTRRGGWIPVRDVEGIARRASSPATSSSRVIETVARPSTPPPGPTSPAAPAPAAPVPAVEPVTGGAGAGVPTPRQDHNFEDVHFDLNRYSIRAAETKILDDAANQLKNDPLLRLNLEGYTCNVGTAAYNLTLGDRRARAVKDYLVSKGVSGDRLRTVSFGETKPKHDNSRRATRSLNRRVALVPEAQP